MPHTTPSATMSAGDQYPWHQFPQEQQIFQDPNPIWLADLQKRLDTLEKIMDRLDKEEKIKKKSLFVQELYDQYKVALALLEDSDE